jgi:antitoxin HigA-1
MGRAAIHPGEHLAEQLEALEISAAELGRRLPTLTARQKRHADNRAPAV